MVHKNTIIHIQKQNIYKNKHIQKQNIYTNKTYIKTKHIHL